MAVSIRAGRAVNAFSTFCARGCFAHAHDAEGQPGHDGGGMVERESLGAWV
jgi:hypothetical protein